MNTPCVLLLLASPLMVPGAGAAPSQKIRPDYFNTGRLEMSDRIKAQTQIEGVWHNHRIWPKENPGPKPPLEVTMTRTVIEKKAAEPLRMSTALKRLWNEDITPAQLQAELDRMERESRDKRTLHEIFAALGNDPFLIAETLVRSNLAARMVRERYYRDPVIHADTRASAMVTGERLRQGVAWENAGGEYYHRSRYQLEGALPESTPDAEIAATERITLSEPAPVVLRSRLLSQNQNVPREQTAGWLFERRIADRNGGLDTETIYIQKRPFNEWWQEHQDEFDEVQVSRQPSSMNYQLPSPRTSSSPGCDEWDASINDRITPVGRGSHNAVWTGSEMIIWSGTFYDTTSHYLNSGSRFTPATGTWTPTTTGANVPSGRVGHTGVWTGSEMIVWGGDQCNGAYPCTYTFFNSGGRYNPSTDTWRTTATGLSAPTGRVNHTAVWTGSEMIVWGGFNCNNTDPCIYTSLNSGARYNPLNDSWSATNSGAGVPLPRYGHTAVWSGTELIVWGGYGGAYLNSGGRYNPVNDSWLPTSVGANVPAGRYVHTAVWTGTEMIIWGGYVYQSGYIFLNTGGRYDPATDSWQTTSTGLNVPQGRDNHTAIWTGSEMIVWGGYSFTYPPYVVYYYNNGARYNPSTNTWTPTSTGLDVPDARAGHTAVWTGTEMIVWGGSGSSSYMGSGGRYDPGLDRWISTPNAYYPLVSQQQTATWTGAEMILWGGYGASNNPSRGSRYIPATNSWLATDTGSGLTGRKYHTAVWSGTDMIIWGGYDGGFQGNGSRYNPATGFWTGISSGAYAPYARAQHTAVWDGSEMIIWGGFNGGTYLGDGGRYNPTTDLWAASAISVGAPAGRYLHTAVWSGSEMIVWGGFGGGYLGSGGRYNPASDTWSATTAGQNAPAARILHSAAWTGNEMIIWGGSDTTQPLSSGARYDPAANRWLPVTGTATPAPRNRHTAVWTGEEMIIWGGNRGGTPLNSGSRYRPASDSWAGVSGGIGNPSARDLHTAVWTGDGMIIWGGAGDAPLNDGAIYHSGSAQSPGNSLHLARPSNINLSWAGIVGAGSYNVRRCNPVITGCIPGTIVSTPITNQYSESNDGVSHFYTIESVNQCGATP